MRYDELIAAANALAVDASTAQVMRRLSGAGIDAVLLKGPVISKWLYRDTARPYGDSDLLVSPSHWGAALRLLEGDGFENYLEALHHPNMESMAGTGLRCGDRHVDLHATHHGLGAAPEVVWETLWASRESMTVAGEDVAVPERPAVLLHICLHAVHHVVEWKPLEDLRRALDQAEPSEWRAAKELAMRLDGVAAFTSGLRLDPRGGAMARHLGLDDAGSASYDLRIARVPLAESLHELLGPGRSWRERLGQLWHEVVPSAAFMRWSHPFARRGTRALITSYPARWAYLLSRAPRALVVVLNARRRHR